MDQISEINRSKRDKDSDLHMSEEDADREIQKLIEFYDEVDKNWDGPNGVVAKHQQYLRPFNITFDENENAITEDENVIKGDAHDSNKIDVFKKANQAIQLLFATLPDSEMVNGHPENIYSSIGGATFMESDKVFITLLNDLHDSTDLKDMFERLEKLAVKNPNYNLLYERLTKLQPGKGQRIDFKTFTQDDVRLITAFWATMKKQNPDVLTVFVLPNGDIVVGDTNLTNGSKHIRRTMASNIVNKIKEDDSKFYYYNAKTRRYYATIDKPKSGDKPAVTKVQAFKLTKELRTYIEFLKEIGIEFTEEELHILGKGNGNHLTMFKKSVEGLKKSLSEMKETAVLNQSVFSANKRLLQLATVRSVLDNPIYESTYFSIAGERTQTFIGTNAISDLYDTLSKLTRRNQLDTTPFKFLNTDVFTKDSSVVLKSLFTSGKKGKRVAGTEEIGKPVYLDGTIDEDEGKRVESSRLKYSQRLAQEFNANKDGVYMNLVPGDASIEWGVRLHTSDNAFVTQEGWNNKEYISIFRNYFIAEVALAQEDRILPSWRNEGDLRFFKSILGDTLHKELTTGANAKMSGSDLYKANKTKIDSAVEAMIKKESDTTFELFQMNGFIKANNQGEWFSNKLNIEGKMSHSEMKSEITLASVNFIIANIELHKIIYSDPYQYADELKRIKNFNSPRQAMMHGDVTMQNILDSVYNEGFSKGDPGWTDMTREHFKTITVADVNSILKDFPGYDNTETDGYEETDGGGIITMKAYRVFRIRTGDWTALDEQQYRHDVIYEAIVKDDTKTAEDLAEHENSKENPRRKATYTPLKPIVSGSKDNGKNYNDIVLDKYALAVYSFRMLHKMNPKSAAIKMYNKMSEEDIDYAVYATGRKVGAEAIVDLYDKKGNFDANFDKDTKTFASERELAGNLGVSEKRIITNIPFSIMGLQTEVPSKDKAQVTRGSQITKLVTMDFMTGGVPIDYDLDSNGNPKGDFYTRFTSWLQLDEDQRRDASELYDIIQFNQELLEEKISHGYDTLLNKLGIKETNEGFEIVNRDILVKTLETEVFKREVNDNLIDAFAGYQDDVVILEATPAYQQIRNTLFSIADSNVTSPKISGGLKVQMTSALLEEHRDVDERTNKKGQTFYTSDELKFYEKGDQLLDKDGKKIPGKFAKTNVTEIYAARWFNSTKSDEELLDEWYVKDADGNRTSKLTLEGERIMKGIAFRTPTQKQNSMEAFVIKKLLPKEYGDSVVVPSALVQKTGSDFDIDKLSLYLKNVYRSASGKLAAVPYHGFGLEAKLKFSEIFYEILGEKITKEGKKKARKLQGTKNLSETFDRIDVGMGTEEDLAKWAPILQEIFATELKNEHHTAKDREDYFMERAINDGKKYAELTDMDKQSILEDAFVEKMYRQSLENAYIQTLDDLITHPMNFENLVKPNSADEMKAIQKEVYKELQKLPGDTFKDVEYREPGFMLSRQNMSRLREAFIKGKQAIAIAATAQTNHAQNQRTLVYANNDMLLSKDVSESDKHWLGKDITLGFKNYNSARVLGKTSTIMSEARNAERSKDYPKGQYISDIIGMFIDGYVDIAAGPWIMHLGAGPEVAGVWLFLVKAGVPIRDISFFMNQPIIRDYLEQLSTAGYSSLFNETMVEDLKFTYKSSTNHKVKAIPAASGLKKTLSETNLTMTDLQKSQQVFFLDEFTKYAKLSEHLFKVQQGTNMDTASLNDSFLVYKKQMQLEEARKTVFSAVEMTEKGLESIPAADGILNSSFIGKLNEHIKRIRDAFTVVLISDDPKATSSGTSVRHLLERVLLPYIGQSDKKFLKTAQKVVSDFFDWAVQTDRSFNAAVGRVLLGNSKERAVALQIMDYKKKVAKDPKHPLYDNMLIGHEGSFQMDAIDGNHLQPNNLKIEGRDNKVFEQNQVISSFMEIKEHLMAMDNLELYNKLVGLAVIQSGLATSPISFTKLLPYQDFKSMYNETLSKLPSLKNLEDFLTLNVFERNNWTANADVVGNFRPKKKWNDRANRNDYPNLDRIDYRLRNAHDDGTLPRMAFISTLNYQAKAFTTVSWDVGSPKEIAAKKKVNDYSYISKVLMKRVNGYDGKPYVHSVEAKNGKVYENYVYKAINAWGDSYRAQELYDGEVQVNLDGSRTMVGPVSKLDNGYTKVSQETDALGKQIESGEVTDGTVLNILEEEDPFLFGLTKESFDQVKELDLDAVTLSKVGMAYINPELSLPRVKVTVQRLVEEGYDVYQASAIKEKICNL